MSIKFLEHTADVRFRVSSIRIENLFKKSADALRKTILEEKVKCKTKRNIVVRGKDLESLMYNFLEEFLILLDSKNFIFSKIKNLKIDLNKFILKATLIGDSSKNYKFYSQVKAITYSEMIIKRKGLFWNCYITLDV